MSTVFDELVITSYTSSPAENQAVNCHHGNTHTYTDTVLPAGKRPIEDCVEAG